MPLNKSRLILIFFLLIIGVNVVWLGFSTSLISFSSNGRPSSSTISTTTIECNNVNNHPKQLGTKTNTNINQTKQASTTTPIQPPSQMEQVLKILITNEQLSQQGKSSSSRDSVPYIVTATSKDYFDRLENFVGSVHRQYSSKSKRDAQVIFDEMQRDTSLLATSNKWMVWNSITAHISRPIVVYNLGLTPEQALKVRTWKNVELVDIDFSLLPQHFTNPKTFAWKPLVMYLALQRFPSIIFLDSGVELWNKLDQIEEILFDKGYFHVVQEGLTTAWKCCGTVGELTHKDSFSYLKLNKKDYESKEMCSGGIQAYIRNSKSYHQVLLPTLHCAWEEKCITPDGSNMSNHRQDQSIFSIFIHKAGLSCERDVKFWGNPGNREGASDSEIIIYLRKGDKTKPFISKIEMKKKFAVVVPFTEKQGNVVLNNLDIWNLPKYQPCYESLDSPETDLIFYLNRKQNPDFEKKVQEKLEKVTYAKCFSKVAFLYADLSDKDDKYPDGPSNQFYNLFENHHFYNQYSHFFYMEPDCKAIRPFWVNVVQNLVQDNLRSNPNFWYIGSNYRGDVDLGEPLQYRFHVNGNAIYSTELGFRNFLSHIRRFYNTLAFDSDPFLFLFRVDKYNFTKHVWNKIIFHEFVQNWWHSNWGEDTLRRMNPSVYFVHGGTNTNRFSLDSVLQSLLKE